MKKKQPTKRRMKRKTRRSPRRQRAAIKKRKRRKRRKKRRKRKSRSSRFRLTSRTSAIESSLCRSSRESWEAWPRAKTSSSTWTFRKRLVSSSQELHAHQATPCTYLTWPSEKTRFCSTGSRATTWIRKARRSFTRRGRRSEERRVGKEW